MINLKTNRVNIRLRGLKILIMNHKEITGIKAITGIKEIQDKIAMLLKRGQTKKTRMLGEMNMTLPQEIRDNKKMKGHRSR